MKRKGKLPRLVGEKISSFGTKRTIGMSTERAFRRMFPLDEDDTNTVHRTIMDDFRRYGKEYDWFYVSFQVNILGVVYGAGWNLFDRDEEDEKWEKKWFSTKVAPNLKDLRANIDDTLLSRLDKMLRGRPAWLLRFRLVMVKNLPPNS